MEGNSNGVQFSDRVLAGQVRNQVLKIAQEALADKTHHLYEVTYLNLVKQILPRQTELSGNDGQPININIVKYE